MFAPRTTTLIVETGAAWLPDKAESERILAANAGWLPDEIPGRPFHFPPQGAAMFEDFEVIHRYTRRQAIEDGMLVDLMQPETEGLIREAGFRFPIAMTATAFSETVAPIDGELPPGQDLKGRLWDVLMVLKAAIRSARETDRIHFTVNVFDGKRTNPVQLWALCGPGDDLEPVLTVMLEGED